MTTKKIGKPFEFNGKTIVAVADSYNNKGCEACVLLDEICNSTDHECIGVMREDKTFIHFELFKQENE